MGLWSANSRLTPAAMRPNEIRESAFRAAANAVSAATVTPGASPRACNAALSRSSASLSLRGLLSAIRQTHPSVLLGPILLSVRATQEDRELEFSRAAQLVIDYPKRQFPRALNSALRCAIQAIAFGLEPIGPITAPFACECQ